MKVTLLRDTYSTNYFTWSPAMSHTELELSRHFLSNFEPQWALQMCLNSCLFIFSDTVCRCEHHSKTTWAGEHFLLQEENLLFSNLFQSTGSDTTGAGTNKRPRVGAALQAAQSRWRDLLNLSFSLRSTTTFSPPCSRLHMATLQAGTVAAQWLHLVCFIHPDGNPVMSGLAAFKGNINSAWHRWGTAHRNHTVQWANNLKI